MMNILFIHKDSRVDALLARLREISLVPVNAVREFDQGLQEVFEKRPDLICIQEEIDGISCVAVAGHIKSLLRENAPRIFLLRNDPGRKLLAGRDCFDDIIELTGFGDDLLAEVRHRLDAIPGMQWRQDSAPVAEGDGELYQGYDAAGVDRVAQELRAAVAAAPLSLTDLQGVASETVSASAGDGGEKVVAAAVPLSSAEIAPPILPVASPGVSAPVSGPDRTPRPVAANGPPGARRNLPGVTPAKAAAPKSAWHEPAPQSPGSDELPGFAEVLAGRHRRQRRSWLFVGSLLVALLLGGGYYLFWPASAGPPRALPAPVVVPQPPLTTPPAPPAPAGIALPPLLAAAAIDAGDGAHKPGWERRVAKDFELLVFREQGAMRAVQVIARGKTGLSAAVVAAVFQLAGGTAVDWHRGEAKGGLEVEQGVLPNRVEVLRYVRPGSTSPAALVVAWP